MSVSKIESFVEVLRVWGSGTIYTDVSKRVSGCRICGDPIPKNTRRVGHFTRLQSVRQLPNGGVITNRKNFYHPECIAAKFMTADVIPRFRYGHCGDCDKRLDGDQRLYACWSGRTAWTEICLLCSELPRWQQCDRCAIFYPRHMIMRIVTETHDLRVKMSKAACRHCIYDSGLTTRADLIRRRNAERQMSDRYDRIRSDLAERGM